MNRVPRASLCVTILDDEDYRILMTLPGGMEAFGVFVAMLILGRERLQQGKVKHLSETDSLKFDNSTTHLLAMSRLSIRQLDRCLKTLETVANESGSKPWMYRDDDSHLVIRSFFKFNANPAWGGAREGAGRHSSRIQDESKKIQLDSQKESSWCASSSVTDSTPTAMRPGASARTRKVRRPETIPLEGRPETADSQSEPLPDDPKSDPAYMEAIGAVRASLSDADAKKLGRDRVGIAKKFQGRWDCIAAAAGETARRIAGPSGGNIHNPFGLMMSIAQGYVEDGGPPAEPPPRPARRGYSDCGPANPTNLLIAPGREHLFKGMEATG
jgi:hypothetical protein